MTHLHAYFHAPQIIGYRKNGTPIRSIAGAEDGGVAVTAATSPTGQQPAATVTAPETGFPANTPLEQMDAQQRENYWKHYARKHEATVKAFGGITPEQLAELQAKAGKHDQLERDLLSGTEKAVADAKDEAAADVAAVFVPRIVNAELKAAAAVKGVSAESLSTALEYVDPAKFLNAKGEDVDVDKINAFIAGIAPATGTTVRRGPSATGHVGNGSGGQPVTGKPGEAGRAEAERRFGKKQ